MRTALYFFLAVGVVVLIVAMVATRGGQKSAFTNFVASSVAGPHVSPAFGVDTSIGLPGSTGQAPLLDPLTRYAEQLGGATTGTPAEVAPLKPPAYVMPPCRWRPEGVWGCPAPGAAAADGLSPQVGVDTGPLEYSEFDGLPPNWNLPSLPRVVSYDAPGEAAAAAASPFAVAAAGAACGPGGCAGAGPGFATGVDHYDVAGQGAVPARTWSRPIPPPTEFEGASPPGEMSPPGCSPPGAPPLYRVLQVPDAEPHVGSTSYPERMLPTGGLEMAGWN